MKISTLVTTLITIATLCSATSLSFAEDKTFWIDVRTANEYQSGHIPEAINLPYDSIHLSIGEEAIRKSDRIYVYCRSGRRSAIALSTLEQLGYTKVENIGGFDDAKQQFSELNKKIESTQPNRNN